MPGPSWPARRRSWARRAPALAGSLAVPVRGARRGLEPAPAAAPGCATASTRSEWIRSSRCALGRRPEIGRALAEYAVCRSRAVRLEVARQYPDLELGPGFIWDQGVHRWTLALALPALLGLRQRGALHEAEAARTVAAARVAEAQDSIVLQVRGGGGGAAAAPASACSPPTRRWSRRARWRSATAPATSAGETSRLEPALASALFAGARGARPAGRRSGGWRSRGIGPGGRDRRLARCPDPTLARSTGGAPDSMSRRFGIVLVLLVLAAVAAGVLLRPERTGERWRGPGGADRGAEPGEWRRRRGARGARQRGGGPGRASASRRSPGRPSRGAPRCRARWSRSRSAPR